MMSSTRTGFGSGAGFGSGSSGSGWADWATQFGGGSSSAPSRKVESYVERCCDPSLFEPNLALDLELADYINQKKANTPRDAAVAVVKMVNHRNPHVSMLALHLLDILVKNCGYPFHLQIATKEFLNELVKRFPERPPAVPNPVMNKILQLVHQWKQTICLTSKYKEDLVHIRDMHRLLCYKGYRMPEVDRRSEAVMNTSENFKSPNELEEEDRAAQGAKLQELIRRGTPRDLAAAQELMKVMAGAEPERKPDYKKQTAKELDKVQQKAILLNDMLNNANPGEKFVRGDAYEQIAQHIRQVQPRIQKWVSEVEEDDGESEAMDRLLLINDLMNQVLQRYEAFKKGDFSATAEIDPALDPKRNTSAPLPKATDLISFDEEEPKIIGTAPTASAASGTTSDLEALASLSLDTPATAPQPQPSRQGPAGLPTDFFSKTSLPPSGNVFNNNNSSPGPAAQLGGWGALQLGDGQQRSGTPTQMLTPMQTGGSAPGASVAQGQAQNGGGNVPGAAAAQSQQPSSMAQQKGKDDPFADLAGIF